MKRLAEEQAFSDIARRESHHRDRREKKQAIIDGTKSGKKGDPIWYNPHVGLRARAWVDGWRAGAKMKKTVVK